MFVDASVIVAVLTEEDDAEELAEGLAAAQEPITSPIAIWEAAASIARKTGSKARAELVHVLSFLALANTRVEPIDAAISAAALSAYDRYGRRSGHAADLNMGDCFAYAFAAERDIPLLYKGKDFARTDVGRFGKR